MRRVLSDPDFREGFAEMLPACIGLIPFGLVCGVGAVTAGATWWGALGMSAIIFSGAAQVIAAQLLAAGAPTAVIVLTCFVAGLRFLMYSASIAPYLRPLPPRLQQALAFLLTDQAFAAAIRRFDAGAHPRAGGLHFLGAGFALWLFWQITNVVGYFAGNLIPPSWSMEFVVPLCFIALIAPQCKSAPSIAAGVFAGAAVVALDGLPLKLNLIAAGLLGIVCGTVVDLARERWTRR
jgi:predicted branched-subunit amino acid permease